MNKNPQNIDILLLVTISNALLGSNLSFQGIIWPILPFWSDKGCVDYICRYKVNETDILPVSYIYPCLKVIKNSSNFEIFSHTYYFYTKWCLNIDFQKNWLIISVLGMIWVNCYMLRTILKSIQITHAIIR